ncbi:V-type H(+)-translocating pyrophosphatase [Reticulomyxa filosa]|uniref:H(+)-exporting diphosphatase n=1 Tax=Reticulomyxa filosa TaxID=46433 RepID=X6NEN3_RETFI|nr:V-type H(+)-translocating pyrophosphatase [Reticulomyxa filosa]|eukprot:ETO24411.1 V-type H(+)-translocating pyrophosphatase [Reticulomyxa filosa]
MFAGRRNFQVLWKEYWQIISAHNKIMTLTNIEVIALTPLNEVIVGILGSIIGLVGLLYFAFFRVLNKEKGGKNMVSIANDIKVGARTFVKKECIYAMACVAIMYIVISLVTNDWKKLGISFLLGSFLSALCGYIGITIAMEANVCVWEGTKNQKLKQKKIRTAQAASKGLNEALEIAFGSGGYSSVYVLFQCGLSTMFSALIGLIIIYLIWGGTHQKDTKYLVGFGFGASIIALFGLFFFQFFFFF